MHKTTLASAYIAAALAACIHSGQLAAPAPSTTYPLAGVVTTVDRAADLVTFRTGSGHLYSLTGCDDWLPGDVIACTWTTTARRSTSPTTRSRSTATAVMYPDPPQPARPTASAAAGASPAAATTAAGAHG